LRITSIFGLWQSIKMQAMEMKTLITDSFQNLLFYIR
jgi:hypothetical protein